MYYISTISAFLCQQYPCPMKSYSLVLINNDDQNDQKVYGSISSFPYTLSSLTPYTSYNVTILNNRENNNRNKRIFYEDVRTLEGGEFYYNFNVS